MFQCAETVFIFSIYFIISDKFQYFCCTYNQNNSESTHFYSVPKRSLAKEFFFPYCLSLFFYFILYTIFFCLNFFFGLMKCDNRIHEGAQKDVQTHFLKWTIMKIKKIGNNFFCFQLFLLFFSLLYIVMCMYFFIFSDTVF